MKVYNSDKSKLKQPVDKFVKQQINLLDFTPIPSKNWMKSRSWEIIKQNIKASEQKVIVWGMALAATISLTVAAGIQLNLIDPIDFSSSKEISQLENEVQVESKKIGLDQEPNNQAVVINRIVSKNIDSNSSSLGFESLKKVSTKINEVYHPVNNNFNIPKIEPYFSFGFQQNTFKPEVGVDFLIHSIQSKFKKQNVKLGLSTEFIKTNQEAKSKLDVFYFANLSLEKVNLRTNKGWAIKTGILLNDIDSNFYTGTTMKLGVSRQFNKWMKAGPELIFTNQWKNIYPSITISFG
jgi:hypothetical protein